jgi:hypothetical protein
LAKLLIAILIFKFKKAIIAAQDYFFWSAIMIKSQIKQVNHQKIVLDKKLVGERMKVAREGVCGLSQSTAAQLLGFKNSSVLSKIEGGYMKKVDGSIIFLAAFTYEVSADYLFGLSDEWERDPVYLQEKHIQGNIFAMSQSLMAREMNCIRDLSNKNHLVQQSISELIPLIGHCYNFLNKFLVDKKDEDLLQEINPAKSAITSTYQKSLEVKRLFLRYSQDLNNIRKGSKGSLPLLEFIE